MQEKKRRKKIAQRSGNKWNKKKAGICTRKKYVGKEKEEWQSAVEGNKNTKDERQDND